MKNLPTVITQLNQVDWAGIEPGQWAQEADWIVDTTRPTRLYTYGHNIIGMLIQHRLKRCVEMYL